MFPKKEDRQKVELIINGEGVSWLRVIPIYGYQIDFNQIPT